MRIHPLEYDLSRSRATAHAHGGYVASVIMLALIAFFATLLLSTPRMIRALDRELRLIEQRQLEKYPAAPEPPAP